MQNSCFTVIKDYAQSLFHTSDRYICPRYWYLSPVSCLSYMSCACYPWLELETIAHLHMFSNIELQRIADLHTFFPGGPMGAT